MMRMCLAMMWLLLLAACAVRVPTLTMSSTVDASKVRFVASQGALTIYPETDCNNGWTVISHSFFGPSVAPEGQNRVVMLDSLDRRAGFSVAEFAFAPSQTLNIGHISGGCVTGLSNQLKAGEEYEVVAESHCGLSLKRLTLRGGVIVREPVPFRQLICDGSAHK